ncbi:MAG TPA: helix-turn-helix domain-containing protein [Baekduia sp.]|uniref:PucR family transcriptional regulator n=1 Tax=Baekduia sp. TaxID=2600305 RepID=UPI002D78FCD0|nr:helix-turn-helix domain-containing protein [Baekduia sp.]HET6505282.1 helix-turn-helix domain-containing protein [Baekduia sp.]
MAIVDAIADLGRTREGAVALLTPSASSGALGYQLDVALATAGERRLAALAIYGAATTSVTAIRLADRTRVALLTIDASVDLTDLAFGLARLIRADPGGVMNRALDAMRAVAAAEADGTEAVLEAAIAAVGSTFALRPRLGAGGGPPAGAAVPIVSDGRPDGWIVGERDDHAATLTAHLLAGAIGRIRTQAIKAARRPAQARADALGGLLTARPAGVARAAERARDVGVRLDGELAVARIELRSEPDRDLVTRRAMDEELDDLVLEVAEDSGAEGEWHRARIDDALLLIHAGPAGTELPAARLLSAARDAFPTATFFCGVGGHHHGVPGLRESATQAATAAAAARGWGRPGTPVHIDAVGLPPLVVDWLGTPAAQDSTERLLRPLIGQGGARADTAIRTLQVYLDERGSLARAGERLHLHKNAVSYRMKRIRAALEDVDVDLDDPDRRLELQLACRAWLLSRSR